MSVKIRLARHGAKKRPYYRIVAAESRAKRDGRFLEHIGSYNPLVDPPAVSLDRPRIQFWLDQGAEPSPTVKRILNRYMESEDIVIQKRATYVPPERAVEPEPEPEPAPAAEEPAAEAAAEEPAAEAAAEEPAAEAAAEEPAAEATAEEPAAEEPAAEEKEDA